VTGSTSVGQVEADHRGIREPESAATSHRLMVLVVTILASSMAWIDGTAVNVALPRMQLSLHSTAADMQWVIEAYSLFLASLILAGGSMGDRWGRRKLFAVGVVVFTIASILCGLAGNVELINGARAIQGIGGALLVPGSLAIITATFPAEERGKAIGTWAGFSTITTAGGPALGGWLVEHVSWRAVFFMNVPLAIVVMVLLCRYVRESKDEEVNGPFDWLGTLLVTAGLAGIVYALIEAGPNGFANGAVVLALTSGVVLLVAFGVVESRAESPMLPLPAFRSRNFAGANLLTLLLYGGLGGSLYFLPFDLQQVQGFSPLAAGASFIPFPIVIFVLSRWSGGLVSRFGARLPLTVGPIVTGCGLAMMAIAGTHANYWTTFFPAILVLSVGMSLVIAPLTTTVMNALPTNQAGLASGVNNAVSRAAGLLAIAVLGIIVSFRFTSSLDGRLKGLTLTSAVRQSIEAQHARFIAVTMPGGLSPASRTMIEAALRASFVDGFRMAMIIAGLLALGSAILGLLFLTGRPHGN
jgi:EmrB/QacA subfamily drug resistance transporter